MNYRNYIFICSIAVLAGLTFIGCKKNSDPPQSSAVNKVLSEPPKEPDPSRYYLFYLHGRIVEGSDGKPVSPDYGTYEFHNIVQTFCDKGFVTISEIREENTEITKYAQKVAGWISHLLKKKVPAKQIIVVGASKGGMIAAKVSSELKNRSVKYVFLAGLFEDQYKKHQIELYGDILSIHDKGDLFPSSPEVFFTSKGIGKSKSIVTDLGLGHGLLYTPHEAWVNEVFKWSGI